MSKKKRRAEECLALHWCKKLKSQAMEFLEENVTPEELRTFLDAYNRTNDEDKSVDLLVKFCNKHPKLKQSIRCVLSQPNAPMVLTEIMKDLDSISIMLLWERDKQIFRFDKDFTEELLRTENLRLAKDIWNYLPYQTFYVDVSDNKELSDAILGKGFFVSILLTNEDKWEIHLCKVTEDLYFGDVLDVPNQDAICDLAEGQAQVEIHELVEQNGLTKTIVTSKQDVDYKTYQMLVAQILTYLSSVEPDINENEHTKQTYRKPDKTAKPKNKYSEVRQWDVGVRFGTAIRAWKKQTSEAESSGRKRIVTSKVRPHSRRAHWHTYLYGKRGEQVARKKWVSQCYINMKIGEETAAPVVIHKVS